MIRYRLACDRGHDFESWFPSSDAYDAQVAQGLVACPICDSQRVEKALMAPAVARSDVMRSDKDAPAAIPAPAGHDAPVPVIAEPDRRMRALLRAVREHVTRTADHVGARFPEEARAIHYGEVPERAIYGEADAEAVRSLIEEGIAVMPLPPAPDDRN